SLARWWMARARAAASPGGLLLVERAVRPVHVVVSDVLAEHPLEVPARDDQDPDSSADGTSNTCSASTASTTTSTDRTGALTPHATTRSRPNAARRDCSPTPP